MKIRESWLLMPNSYFFAIEGKLDSKESGKGEWVVWYNEHNYPNNKEDLKEYHYETEQFFSLDTVVDVSYEVFKRLRLITRFLNYGQKAIKVIEKCSWLKETNHCIFQIKEQTDIIVSPV